jgi:hypothetical protein
MKYFFPACKSPHVICIQNSEQHEASNDDDWRYFRVSLGFASLS